MPLFLLSAVLMLFAGCDKGDQAPASIALLDAATVNCNAITAKVLTQGSDRLTFQAQLVNQTGGNWCSFNLNNSLLSTEGSVGSVIYMYLQRNTSPESRTVQIMVTYSDNYTASFTLTQTAFSISVDFDRAWAEQPEYRSEQDFIYKTYFTTLFNGEYVRNYSICYDREKHISHWVAYPVHRLYTTPSISRTNAWAYDPNNQPPTIPDSDQQYILSGYGAGSYDRGHMLASATRYSNRATNAQTFYPTNMMPQFSRFNQGIWGSLEGNERSWGGMQKYDTLFVVTGTHFADSKTIANRNGPIAVPSHCWKVLLRQRGNENRQIGDFGADELQAIAFLFTNDTAGASTSLRQSVRSVEEIEQLTGFKFFRNLDPSIATQVKQQKNISYWSGL